MASNVNRQQQAQKQYTEAQKYTKFVCKLCFMSGKKDYNHELRDRITGKTKCPYLLNLVCGFCKKKAEHTTKYCPEIKNKEVKKQETPKKKEMTKKQEKIFV